MKKNPTVNALLAAYRQRRPYRLTCHKIEFHGVAGFDVYNPTKPFRYQQQWIMAARVEARESELSQVRFFRLENFKSAYLLEDAPVFDLQDPFICQVGGEMVFGGVEVAFTSPGDRTLIWKTRFWRGKDLASLRHFADGPPGMKDIRLVDLEDGRILLFTRPQGALGGRGKIGWKIIHTLEELTPEVIEQAQLLEHVDALSWCGVNEAWLSAPNCVEVLAHVACFDEQGNRHYYAAAFNFDVSQRQSSPIRIMAERNDFLAGEAKRRDLSDVIFPGGLLLKNDNTVLLFCGTSDCEVQVLLIAKNLYGIYLAN
ncbi:hypothetical protein M976_01456 [Buttiauxella ferragutiae ATCC 51602]|uniref:DUF1861 family protein n=1 Tax=Buttiauxella ferragutiae ATCC 51602 TaxID=1354252 RepID=A0ABX2WA21_9ENTR|nr:DUF1861 family protein [Buttiauxella ferragutiae]OAT29149.1 hypothetical protein M976_01456 [Buttiauxella ferragutiae ATCC 51602]